MSAKGHQALADAIEAKLAEPPPTLAPAPKGPALGYEKVCACQKKLHPENSCSGLPRAPDLDCLRTYEDCSNILGCIRGDASVPPKCLTGWKNAGPEHRCVPG